MIIQLTAPPLSADQTVAELDDLFLKLQTTDDPNFANQVTQRIWVLWHQTSDPDTKRLLSAGIQNMSHANYKRAANLFTRVIEQSPQFAEGWNKRATVYYLMGKYAQSAADVKQTLLLEPRHFGALSGLGLIYMAVEDPSAAAKAFEDALAVNPHLADVRRNLKNIREEFDKQSI